MNKFPTANLLQQRYDATVLTQWFLKYFLPQSDASLSYM